MVNSRSKGHILAFWNETHNNNQEGGGERQHALYRTAAVTFVRAGKEYWGGKNGKQEIGSEGWNASESIRLYFLLLILLPSLSCPPSLFFSSPCALFFSSPGGLCTLNTRSKPSRRKTRIKEGWMKAARGRRYTEYFCFQKRHEDREEGVKEDKERDVGEEDALWWMDTEKDCRKPGADVWEIKWRQDEERKIIWINFRMCGLALLRRH